MTVGIFKFKMPCFKKQTRRSNYFPGIYSWLSQRHLKLNMLKIELNFFSAYLVLYPLYLPYFNKWRCQMLYHANGKPSSMLSSYSIYHQVPHSSHLSLSLHFPPHWHHPCPGVPSLLPRHFSISSLTNSPALNLTTPSRFSTVVCAKE